jgi:hypothetical protein
VKSNRNVASVVACIVAVAVIGSCGSPDNGVRARSSTSAAASDGAQTGGDTPAVDLPAVGDPNAPTLIPGPADPISITVAADDTLTTSAPMVAADGGELSATGPDGTTFKLTIPADALQTDTTITMTPLTSVTGIPWGDAGAVGVKLGPDGLTFDNFVTLTVQLATPLPADQQVPFGYSGDTSELVLAVVDPASETIDMKLMHFSGYGVSKGYLADVEPVRQRLGGSDEARLSSGFALDTIKARQEQLAGTPEGDAFQADAQKFIDEWFNKVVKPRVDSAAESCANGQLAVDSMLEWQRMKQLLGDQSPLADVSGVAETAGLVCAQEEYELCRDQHIVHRMVPVWILIDRRMQLLGSPTSKAAAKAKELAVKCMTFELRLESTAIFDDPGGGYTSTVTSKVKLVFDPGSMSLKGTSALINTAFDFHISGCNVVSTRGGGTFDVDSVMIFPEERAKGAKSNDPGKVADITVTYYPGVTSESATITCDGATIPFPPSPLWTAVFIVTHFDEIDEAGAAGGTISPIDIFNGNGPDLTATYGPRGPGFVASNWEILGGQYFAKKEWQMEMKGEGLLEVGTFKLYHNPT